MAKLVLKILGLVLLLALLFIAGYEVWGETFELLFSREATISWFSRVKGVAWAWGIGLLVSDIILPVPASGIMAALGNVYGLALGALVGIIGSIAAGVTGYMVARSAGRKATRFLASEEELERFRFLFDRWGGAAIIVSRALPILPEVMSILAGLARMSFSRFLTALLLGTVPTCLLFAAIGQMSRSEPRFGITFAILLPLLLWPIFLRFVFQRKK
jgi:uncharacterized membrane protein YdjX (TVP38/TMEM64 family)